MRWRRLVPGAIAAHGDTLWLADKTRPCLLQIHDGRLIDVHWWGAPDTLTSSALRLHADSAGVWVVAEDRVVHCTLTGAVSIALAEPVGATALGHSRLAAASASEWPTRPGPDLVRLLSSTGPVGEVEVPGEIHELVPTREGFLAYVVDHGPTATSALLDRTARLATITTTGKLTLGLVLAARSEWLSTLVGGSHPAVLSSAGGSWPPRLTAVLGDLSPAPGGLPIAPMGMWGGEQSGGRAAVTSHAPDGAGYLLTVVDLAASAPIATYVVTGHPDEVAFGTPDLLWVNLIRTDGADHRQVVMSWDLTRAGAVVELDLASLGGSAVMLPMSPPFGRSELAVHVEEQRLFFEGELRSSRSFETLDVTSQGDWPQMHVIARVRLLDVPDRVAAMAWPLFDGDGRPDIWDWTDHVHIDIDERAEGFSRIADSTPRNQLVWLRAPGAIEGLVPEG